MACESTATFSFELRRLYFRHVDPAKAHLTTVCILHNCDVGRGPVRWLPSGDARLLQSAVFVQQPSRRVGDHLANHVRHDLRGLQDPCDVCACYARRGSSNTNRQASHCTPHETPLISLEGMGLRQHLAASVSSEASMEMRRIYLVSATKRAITAHTP